MQKKILDILFSISPESNFQNSSNFLVDGLIDSFDVILITKTIEDCFDIAILGEDITPENFSSVASLENLISRSAKRLQ